MCSTMLKSIGENQNVNQNNLVVLSQNDIVVLSPAFGWESAALLREQAVLRFPFAYRRQSKVSPIATAERLTGVRPEE